MSPRRARAVERGTEEPAAALRALLIEVTGRLLAEDGLHGLTTRKIASAAGVADGVLYNHFSDKDTLVLLALQGRFKTLVAAFLEAVPDPDTPLPVGLRHLADACLVLQRGVLPLAVGLLGRPDLLGRFFTEVHTSSDLGAHHVMAAILGYLGHHRRDGTIDTDVDPGAVATLLIGATSLEALSLHLAPESDSSLGEVTAFLLRGLAPTSERRPA